MSLISPYSSFKEMLASEFTVGIDKFENLEINKVDTIKNFHFFKDKSKPISRYVSRFVLKKTALSAKTCTITLIKNESGKFEPRFDFQIINLSKKAAEELKIPISEHEERLIKAHVNLDDCHKQFSQLLSFLEDCNDIELSSDQYAIVTGDQKKLLDKTIKAAQKSDVLDAIALQFGHSLTEQDIVTMTKRKNALNRFKSLLTDPDYFLKYQQFLKSNNKSNRREDVWQHFFENNTWIFGYGLQLVSCENLSDRKLETIVAGSDVISGAGKRIDGLLKTRGVINRSLFAEIKLHDAPLLEKYPRSAVWTPGEELRGAVAQMQKTQHKVALKVTQNMQSVTDLDGNPTGELLSFVKPRGVIVVGTLDQFSTPKGLNEEKFASFELYRQSMHGIEIITYDELYERARYIIENV